MTQIFSNLIPIFIAIIVFSILVIVHEFGHYIVAKKSGIFVEEFAVGMGPILISKKIGETIYSIRALPLGGFCRMMGEDENCNDERAFNQKSVFKRMAVVVAGPFMNFVLAFFICTILVSSSGFATTTIESLISGGGAEIAGLKVGDQIKKINNVNISVYEDLSFFMMENNGEKVTVEIKRENEKLKIDVQPFQLEDGRWILGFSPKFKIGFFGNDKEGYEKATIFETIKTGFDTMCFYIRSTIIGFIRLFTFNVSVDEIAGPIGIIEVVGNSYEQGIKHSLGAAISNISSIAALLSANLGAINLFPIPAMDGGRLIFLIIESFRGKPISPEKEGMIHFVGFACLMAFMVFIAYNDISRIFFN